MAQVPDATVADWWKTSPYAAKPPQTDAGLLGQAALPQAQATNLNNGVATVDASAYDPAAKPAATMKAATGGAATYGATGYDASQAAATDWAVDANQTVEGRLGGLLASGSPLMTQAATKAAEAANGRGLLNSSMAVGEGQKAVIASALPIAQADAATFAAAGKYKADAANATSQFNTTAENEARTFRANATNAADAANAQAVNTQALTNQQAENTAAQVNTTQANALQSQLLQQRQQVEQANQQAVNTAASQTATMNLQAQTANLSAAVQQAGQAYDGALKVALANADAAGKLQLQQIDAATRAQLADMQAKYNVQMQSSASMANTYTALINQSAAVMSDQNLDFAGKQAALNSLTKVFNNAMAVQSSISGLDLGTLLEPEALVGGATVNTSPSSADGQAAAVVSGQAANPAGNPPGGGLPYGGGAMSNPGWMDGG